ncbi:MAG: zinc ribbon domain-containing protein [Phycisphaerales bacterium]
MSRSHLCSECGRELARVRARREPVYGLWLVTCPHCGRHQARRRDPWRELIRWFLRADALVTAAGLQLAAAAASCIIGLIAVAGGWELLTGTDGNVPTDPQAIVAYAIFAVGGAGVCGAWLTAGLLHWRRWAAWTVYGLGLFLASFGIVVFANATELWQARGRDDDWGTLLRIMTGPPGRRMLVADAGIVVALTGTFLAAATVGLPIGWGIVWITSRLRMLRWRTFRRRARRARNVMS